VNKVGIKVCEALGLDPNMVNSVEIKLGCDGESKVCVEFNLFNENSKALEKALVYYELMSPTDA